MTEQEQLFWDKAPEGAWVWERFPSGKCLWHCRKDGKSFDRKAPNFDTARNTLWRDKTKQLEADEMNGRLNKQLSDLNIVLA